MIKHEDAKGFLRGTAAGVGCQYYGHCYHEGTAVGVLLCCRCGEKPEETMAERLKFYDDKPARMGAQFRKVKEVK